MIMPLIILVFSTALFFFYIQAICERALRREFSHPYFQDIINAIQLEFPSLRDDLAANVSLDHSEMHLALKCDFITLEYLLKNSDRTRRRFSRHEKVLMLYFRFLLFCLPIRHAFKLRERDAVLHLTTILQYFANLTGERLSVSSLGDALPNLQS
ncbi:MAG: hypothetical protein M1423_06840 [Acidobacteria bacterium]|nr:hypothetical protein [Acidobacteriota bacterium]